MQDVGGRKGDNFGGRRGESRCCKRAKKDNETGRTVGPGPISVRAVDSFDRPKSLSCSGAADPIVGGLFHVELDSSVPITNLLDKFLLGTDQRTKTFGQESRIEGLLERLVNAGTIEAHRATVIGQQCDEDGFSEVSIATQILTDL